MRRPVEVTVVRLPAKGGDVDLSRLPDGWTEGDVRSYRRLPDGTYEVELQADRRAARERDALEATIRELVDGLAAAEAVTQVRQAAEQAKARLGALRPARLDTRRSTMRARSTDHAS